jgi:hypothetical protein
MIVSFSDDRQMAKGFNNRARNQGAKDNAAEQDKD